jgi:hypothetical protein
LKLFISQGTSAGASASHDPAEIRRGVLRIVHGVHEHAVPLRGDAHLTVHVGRRRRDDPPRAVQVLLLERPAA